VAETGTNPDRFDEAVRAFRKRVPMTRDEWDTLDVQQRERAFTVSKVTQGRVIQDVFDAIDRAIEEGVDLESFKDSVRAELADAWGGEIPGRLETIFRTNTIGAYSEGRWAISSSPTVREARPYLRCSGIGDDRQCDICEPLDGVVRAAEEWESADLTPPFHFNCRDILVPLSREEAEEEGIDDAFPDVDADEGFGAAPSEDGTNWDFDLSGMDPELRAAVEDALSGR
jgi:SPP1 gp7 family putative phage head morphogenesis protein